MTRVTYPLHTFWM